MSRSLYAGLLALLLVPPVLVHVDAYHPIQCDDKAVYYYSSAFLFADAQARREVLDTLPAWMDRIESTYFKLRLAGRICYANCYLAYDATIHGARQVLGRDASYDQTIKVASMTLMLFAIGWFLWVARGTPGHGLTAMAVYIALATLGTFSPLEPLLGSLNPLQTFTPRGPFCVFTIAALLSLAQKRIGLLALSALLMISAHAGQALLVLPLLALAALTTRRMPGSLVLIVATLVAWAVLSPYRAHMPHLPDDKSLAALPACVTLLALAALLLVHFTIVRRGSLASLGEPWSGLFRLAVSFLLITQVLLLPFIAVDSIQDLAQRSGIHLLHELPHRLTMPRFAAASLAVFLAAWQAAVWLGVRAPALRRVPAHAWVALVVLAAALPRVDVYRRVLTGQSAIFQENCVLAEAPAMPVSPAELDPRDEPAFFVRLAEYLGNPRAHDAALRGR